MRTKPLTEKEVHERLPKELLKKLKAEFEAPVFKAFTAVAIAAAPECAGRASVRLIQVCCRRPSAEDLAVIFGAKVPEPEPAAEVNLVTS